MSRIVLKPALWLAALVFAACVSAFSAAHAFDRSVVPIDARDIEVNKLPGTVQQSVTVVLEHKLVPVVLTGEAVKKFSAMNVLAHGPQAELPDVVAFLVMVDDRETPSPEGDHQTVMAFDKDGNFLGAIKEEVAFVLAVLHQLSDDEKNAADKGI